MAPPSGLPQSSQSKLRATAEPFYFYPAAGESSSRGARPAGHGVDAARAVVPATTPASSLLPQAVQTPKVNHYTHFISLPFVINQDDVIKLNLDHFQRLILGNEDGHKGLAIDESLFAKPETLHVTVLMVELSDPNKIKIASDLLKSISEKVNEALENQPISLRLRGLKVMDDCPDKARVVYAPVQGFDGEGRLVRVRKIIVDAFSDPDKHLRTNAGEEFKPHVTIMNARFRKSNQPNNWFDARDILTKYGENDWGEFPIREIHLSKTGSYGKSGYNHCLSIQLPSV